MLLSVIGVIIALNWDLDYTQPARGNINLTIETGV